jgi:glucose-6-phosphate 1-dehydrogenase
MIERLVLFGATGDLAGRYLLPALAALQAAVRLPSAFSVIGASREKLDDVAFRRSAREQLEQHAAGVPSTARETVARSLRYRPVDVTDPESVASVIEGGAGPVAAYLALPPGLFPAAVTALARVGLPPGSRVVLEKPFGEDLESAIALNWLLAETLGPAGEQAVFRVDHVLGMATVQNLRIFNVGGKIVDGTTRGLLNGPPGHWIETLRSFAVELGFDTFVFWPEDEPFVQLERFAEEVVPAVRG